MSDSTQVSKRLPAHLAERYGVPVTGASLLQAWNPSVIRVDREDGSSWVARLFAPARPLERIDGDAEILLLLEDRGYPAERCADREAVSTLDGWTVLVTEYIEGELWDAVMRNAAHEELERSLRELGGMLGRLHTLPIDGGAASRDGGSWGGDPLFEGLPGEDIAGAKSLLAEIEGRVPTQHGARYDSLREQLERADPCNDLPRALVHPDFAGPNIIMTLASGPVAIDWTAAGSGPRVVSFGWFLGGAGLSSGWDPRRVDAIVAGYHSHVSLEDDELERLARAMQIRPLYFACWYFRGAIVAGLAPTGPGEWWCTDEDNDIRDAIAAHARAAFRG